MNLQLQIRRATLDDRAVLMELWNSMQLPANELEKRLTEFQVVQNERGEILGAIGIQFSKRHALLHSEGYSDFGVADAARQLFWERVQTLASNHGVFRIWTQENSPFWLRWGFQPAGAEMLTRLPPDWKNENAAWFSFELKNEDAIQAALEKEFSQFSDFEKQQIAGVAQRGKTIRTIFTVICFAIFLLCIAVIFWLLRYRNPFVQ
ncbi:MAG TPA: hypothetical protein VFV23_09080 [Verrucomicrobiae bacterium]|nr:hypothetical protein [Verrucomicrobiae bacterium]